MPDSVKFRIYGNPPFNVVTLHGGPGAPGGVAPIARELAINHGVLEPFQTRKSINGQIKELYTFIKLKFLLLLSVTPGGHGWHTYFPRSILN